MNPALRMSQLPERREGLAFPTADTPSIAIHRIVNAAAYVAPFSASRWSLEALEPADRNPTTLVFTGWPTGFQRFARHCAYALINNGNPESFSQAFGGHGIAWLSTRGISNTLSRIRSAVIWLAGEWSDEHPDTPVKEPRDLDSFHLADIRAYVEKQHTRPHYQNSILVEIIRLWHLNPWLPDDCQWPRPRWIEQDWRQVRNHDENKTRPIPEGTYGPLLEWALAFVTDFASDIFDAVEEFDNRITRLRPPTGTFVAAGEILDGYIASGVALPPVPPWMKSDHTNGIAWKVLEYRHLIPSISFSSAFRGIRPASLLVDRDAGVGAVSTKITAEFHGRPWIPFIHVYDVVHSRGGTSSDASVPLLRHLRTAALIVVTALTGMRPDEVLSLRTGCAPEPLLRPGGSRLQLINGNVTKGVPRSEDGSIGEARPAAWATITEAATAIRVAEQIRRRQGKQDGFVFSEGTKVTMTSVATGWIESFIDFVNTRLAPETDSPSAFSIPSDQGDKITLRRFRRTLAWHLRHRPNGDITMAIQYQQLGVAVGEGYAGTKASGIPDLLLTEDWNQRANMIRQLDVLLRTGGGLSGPAASRAIGQTQKLPRLLMPGDERRLKKDKDITIYDNPGAMALCIFAEETALCKKLDRSKRDVRPDLSQCVEGCGNCARTDAQLDELKDHAAALRRNALLSPVPMAQSLSAQAERFEQTINDFERTRLTLTLLEESQVPDVE